jgi:predicted anti-sigma-YlaC factor YlaD
MDLDRCSEWRELASCRLDGELDELQVARLERHLLGCDACCAWMREITALASVLHEPDTVCPDRLPDLRTHTLRRRLVRSASATSAAAAAAVAAFAIAVPGAAVSIFSSAKSPAVSSAPCASCMKKQALTVAPPPSTVAPVHVAHPNVG